MTETVAYEIRERTLIIALQREHKRNAVDQELSAGIEAGIDKLEQDPEVWCGILTGTRSVFSAGTDLAAGYSPKTGRGGEYGLIRRRRSKPLIAAVEGPAVGGGFELVLACDLVVASRNATFGLPEVRRGVIANCGALFRGPRALPLNFAREMLFTGDPVNAERLYEVGLVNQLTEPGGAVIGALDLATRICRNSPTAVAQTRNAVEIATTANDADGWLATESSHRAALASGDAREGRAAFLEKRPPRWAGLAQD